MYIQYRYSVCLFMFSIAQSLRSKSWDPACTEKLPSCKPNGEFYLNTACEYNNCDPRTKSCQEVPSDVEFRQMVLDQHNELRNKVASGEEKRSSIVAAADMRALSYDLALEFTSICHVHGCKMEHDNCRGIRNFKDVGQNLALRQVEGKVPLTKKQVDKMVNMNAYKSLVIGWYETEIEKDDFKDLIDKLIRFNHETGHFTAMIWAKTTHLGCARALDRPNDKELTMHITCNYHPPGNVNYSRIYTKGAPCSKCRHGTSCNSKYTSLCGEIDDKDVHFGPNPYRKLDKAKGISEEAKGHSKASIPVWNKYVLIFSYVILNI